MKRFLLLAVSSCVVLFAFSQEEIRLDSVQSAFQKEKLLFPSELTNLAGNSFDSGFKLSMSDYSIFHQPLLPDFSKNLDFSKYVRFSFRSGEINNLSLLGISPFIASGVVFNQSVYRLSDRIAIGGNSFGARSVLDQPQLNPGIQDMSLKGASMFLQYKVSKNFKVEGRVSVSNHSNPWAY